MKSHPGLIIALCLYVGLSLSYFFIMPIFEGPDEWTHTGHIQYMAEGYGLPVMLPGQGIWGGQQPPLYFVGGAVLVQPFTLEGVQDYELNRRNPHAAIGYALDPGNKNNYLHTPAENFPYRGLALTVHVLRLYSMAWGVVALIFIYLTAFDFAARWSQPGLFAGAVAVFVAAQPMFNFINAAVANEPANIALCAVGLWLAQRYVLYGPSPHLRRAIALGVTLGLIALAKMTGLAFGLVAVVAFLIAAIQTRHQPGAARRLWRDGVIVGGLFLAVAGWWYARNFYLYGDFFQQGLYKLYFNVDPQPLTLDSFLDTLFKGEVSFWATFGWLNVVAPQWVYDAYWIVSRVGLVGLLVGLLTPALILPLLGRKLPPSDRGRVAGVIPALILHVIFPVALAFSLTRLVAIEGGLQGRQLLPALGSLAILIIAGWWSLSPSAWRPYILGSVLLGYVGVAGWLPYGIVAPEYIPRPLLTEADLPADLARLDWTYNDDMRLLGVRVAAESVRPGERVPVTAYWQALRPMDINYSVFVHLIGRDYENVGQFNTYPGLGLRPTRTLEAGQIVADTYPVLVNGGSEAPSRLLVNIGLYDFRDPDRAGIIPAENPPASTVAALKLIPQQWPTFADTSLADFAAPVSLVAARFDGCPQHCILTLDWLAHDSPGTDYTVFVHLWAEGAANPIGFDAPPLNGDYPTSLWAAGERIRDPHPLDLSGVPAGTYTVNVGLYHFETGARLPATRDGAVIPDYAVEVGTLTVGGERHVP